MEYNLLSQINPGRHNWRIKVRIARIWHVSGTSKGKDFSSLELVLVDEEVHHIIHLLFFVNIASIVIFTSSLFCRAKELPLPLDRKTNKFSKSLVEGHCYYIRNFQVSKQERKFKAIPSTYTIFFTSWTTTQEIHAEVTANLPRYFFNFVDYGDLDHIIEQDMTKV